MKPAVIQKLDALPLPEKAIIRRMGYPRGDYPLPEPVKIMFEEEMRRSPDLMKGRCAYRIFSIVFKPEGVLLNEADTLIRSLQVKKMLKEAVGAAVFMATIGSELEKEVARLMGRDEMTRSLILDAIGSETADEVANRVHHEIIGGIVRSRGFEVTPRFSPGYGDWSIECQKEMLRITGGERIGISVTESSLMQPRKSVSALFGWKVKKTHG